MTAIPQTLEYFGPDLEEKPALTQDTTRRPLLLPFWYFPSLFIATISFMTGGSATLNDVAMIAFLLASAAALLREIFVFKKTLGAGGLALYGGALIWFCHDYFYNWFGPNYALRVSTSKFPASHLVLAKGICLISIFMLFASLGLRIKKGKRVERLMASVPEPADTAIMLIVIIAFLIGISPYFFATDENPFAAMLKDMFAMRSSDSGTRWTMGRTGNLNYNWGAYIFHLTTAGEVGAILGACYAFSRPANPLTKVVCISIWAFELMLAFGTGARGPMLAMALPVVSIILWRAWIFEGNTRRAVVIGTVLMFILLVVVQYQGTFRTATREERDINELSLFKSQGNMMFTEGLEAYAAVPTMIPHPGDRFPGAPFIRPLPEIAYRFGTGWIPRALWNDKPNSLYEFFGGGADFNFAAYYNEQMTGGSAFNDASGSGGSGGTVAVSIVGMGYVPYGIPGLIQIALLFGWLCKIAEGALRLCADRLLGLIFVMGFITYLVRAFRDLTPHDLYPLVIGVMLVSILIKILGSKKAEQAYSEYSDFQPSNN